jgi:beta-lactamase regulating signal transducer with metallopeptidase domain
MNLSEILSERLVQALGWTILHSLWQGALIAILLGVLMIMMRSYSSQSRYFVSVSALLTVFVLSVVTFVSYYNGYQPTTPSSNFTLILPVLVPTDVESVERVTNNASWSSVLGGTEIYFREHLPLIVSVWLLGILLLVVRFLGGYAYLQRMKHYQVKEVNKYWQGTLVYLAAEIGVKQKVRLLESALAEVPMVIGWLKPVILLPVGTLTGLSITQVESILAHELAHLKRHDYLVNIFQSMLEIVLFYNPFVWWISGYIRQERENCCDDIAVEITGDTLTLVKTLTMLEELRLVKPQLAMGFAGTSKGGLLSRVRRLLSPKRKASGFSEGFLSALVLVFCLGITTVNAYTPYNWKNLQNFASKSWENIQNVTTDLVEAVLPTENTGKPSKPAKVGKANQEITELREKMPHLKPLQYMGILDTIRFGKDMMAITDRSGRVKMYKAGKEIPKEDFEKYKEEFSVVPTPKKSYTFNGQDTYSYSFPDLPAMPAMPSMPSMPSIPSMPSPPVYTFKRGQGNVIFAPEGWEDIEVIENGRRVKRKVRKQMKRDAKSPRAIIINPSGQEVIINGNEKAWEDWGKHWEKWGEQWGKWGEQWGEKYGKEWEKWGEEVEKAYGNMSEEDKKKLEKSLERLVEEQSELQEKMQELREKERELREDAREREREARDEQREAREREREAQREAMENLREEQLAKHRAKIDEAMDKVKAELVKDGLMEVNAKSLKIISKKNSITVNGKELSPELETKYRAMLSESFGVPKDGNKDHNWMWQWNDDDED